MYSVLHPVSTALVIHMGNTKALVRKTKDIGTAHPHKTSVGRLRTCLHPVNSSLVYVLCLCNSEWICETQRHLLENPRDIGTVHLKIWSVGSLRVCLHPVSTALVYVLCV